jgi:hypothetical protein
MSMTPEQRARAWYPSSAWGGGNNEAVYKGVSGRFLWKPVSDSTKKAAIHTPANVRVDGVTVAGKRYGVGSIGNGYRPLFRLDKPGSAYGNGIPVTMHLHGGGVLTIVVPEGGKRYEKSGFADHGAAPVPANPPASSIAVQSVMLPAEYSAKVGLVAVLSGRKMHQCTRDTANPARWTHPGKRASKYGLRWNVRPGGSVATFNAGIRGLWSVYNGERFFSLAEIVAEMLSGAVQPAPAVPPVVPPVVTPPAPVDEPLHVRTPNTLTLRADFAAVVSKVDAMANVIEPGNPKPIILAATRSGNTWTLRNPLGWYPKGNRPNTWRISLKGTPPAGVTWHTSINQTFLREGDSNTYPPTTRP